MMSIVDMRCPRCGKQATEYDENKWRCLKCNTKFIYEGPIRPNNYTLEKHIHIIDEDTHFFTCAVCNGTFPKTNTPVYKCRKCGATLCAEHAVFEELDRPPICIKCNQVTESQASGINKLFKGDIEMLLIGIFLIFLSIFLAFMENRWQYGSTIFLILGLLVGILAVCALIKDYKIKRNLDEE